MDKVFLVYDGKSITVPECLGSPRSDQLLGTFKDRLIELAGRVCYDSLGQEKSRDSVGYHKHIAEVNHGSVWRHANVTMQTIAPVSDSDINMIALACFGRPGVILKIVTENNRSHARITANIQAVREWHKKESLEFVGDHCPTTYSIHNFSRWIHTSLITVARVEAPLTMYDMLPANHGPASGWEVVRPVYPDEIWVSFLFTDVSRVFTHELVRHAWHTAPSQRSGRYCDDSETPWVPHPAIVGSPESMQDFDDVVAFAREKCRSIFARTHVALKETGMDNLSAKKQARSASRGVLGNAVGTEILFSANLSEWKIICNQRCHPAADDEIRLVMERVREILLENWPDHFP